MEKIEKNWRMAIAAKKLRGIRRQSATLYARFTHMLAIRRNCSNKFRGRKVMMVYFEVMTWFV